MPARAFAIVRRRLGDGSLVRLYALADQGFGGVGNVLVFALLGRLLPAAEFGAIGMMIGVHFFIAGFHRSAVVLPFSTDFAPDSSGAGARHEHDVAWWWMGVACSLILSAGLCLVALPIHLAAPASWQWAIAPLLLAALISPAMLAWEFARRWLYKNERAPFAAAGSLAYAVTLCGGAWLAARLHPGAGAAALAWIAASLVAIAVIVPAISLGRPHRAIIAELARKNRETSGWLAATHLPYAVYSTATVVVLISALIGPIAAALFTAARTLTNPAASLITAIDSVDKPRAARALAEGGIAALNGSIRRTRALIAVSTGLFLGAVALFAGPLVEFVFHGRYPGLQDEVRWLALAFFLVGLNQPTETMMIVLRAGRAMLAVRVVTAVATVLALTAARPWGVSGMALAICATQALSLVLLFVVEKIIARRMEAAAR